MTQERTHMITPATGWGLRSEPERPSPADQADPSTRVDLRPAQRASAEQLLQIVEDTSDIVVLVDPAEGVFHDNAAARMMFGPLRGRRARECLAPTSRLRYDREVEPAMRQGERWTGDLVAIDRHGGRRTLSALVQPHLEDGQLTHISATLRDVTDERTVARELARQARLDPLTDLPNRVALMEQLERVAAWSLNGTHTVAVLFIDLDNLKVVNDSLGHRAGDDLLVASARRLRSAVANRWVLGRFGGDEFVVLCDDLRSPDEAVGIATTILTELEGAVEVNGIRVQLEASIGVAVPRGPVPDPETLLREADAAMYEAKRRGRNRVVMFDDQLHQRVHRRLQLGTDLRAAIDEDAIESWLQPIVDVESGRIDGCEALARWPGSGNPPAQPVEFIGLAEESGLITTLGLQLFASALVGAGVLRAAHPSLADMRIGSNLSGRQLTEPGCGQALLEIIAASGIPPEHVVLELTETVLIAQGDAVDRVFRELCDAGVTLCLDDFGSGYSSLSHLRRYPIGVVKLDTSYVQSFTTDPGALIIAEAVVQMAQRLDLMVVAEGVETDEQLAAVRELGIAKAQGYLLGRPAPAHTLLPDVVARAERYRAAPPG